MSAARVACNFYNASTEFTSRNEYLHVLERVLERNNYMGNPLCSGLAEMLIMARYKKLHDDDEELGTRYQRGFYYYLVRSTDDDAELVGFVADVKEAGGDVAPLDVFLTPPPFGGRSQKNPLREEEEEEEEVAPLRPDTEREQRRLLAESRRKAKALRKRAAAEDAEAARVRTEEAAAAEVERLYKANDGLIRTATPITKAGADHLRRAAADVRSKNTTGASGILRLLERDDPATWAAYGRLLSAALDRFVDGYVINNSQAANLADRIMAVVNTNGASAKESGALRDAAVGLRPVTREEHRRLIEVIEGLNRSQSAGSVLDALTPIRVSNPALWSSNIASLCGLLMQYERMLEPEHNKKLAAGLRGLLERGTDVAPVVAQVSADIVASSAWKDMLKSFRVPATDAASRTKHAPSAPPRAAAAQTTITKSNLKFRDNSCPFDSALIALFKNPRTELATRVATTTELSSQMGTVEDDNKAYDELQNLVVYLQHDDTEWGKDVRVFRSLWRKCFSADEHTMRNNEDDACVFASKLLGFVGIPHQVELHGTPETVPTNVPQVVLYENPAMDETDFAGIATSRKTFYGRTFKLLSVVSYFSKKRHYATYVRDGDKWLFYDNIESGKFTGAASGASKVMKGVLGVEAPVLFIYVAHDWSPALGLQLPAVRAALENIEHEPRYSSPERGFHYDAIESDLLPALSAAYNRNADAIAQSPRLQQALAPLTANGGALALDANDVRAQIRHFHWLSTVADLLISLDAGTEVDEFQRERCITEKPLAFY